MARIEGRFQALKAAGRAGLVTITTAGDPDYETAREILFGLPEAGADIIELGMAFTDPMADGPAIQVAGQRALKAGITLKKTLALVESFRARDRETPIILMGYYNPIYSYGIEAFLSDAGAAGVDGFIIVDLPSEEDEEFCLPALAAGFSFIRMATPTTDDQRLPAVLANASGFVYYVSYTGITGAQAANDRAVAEAVARLRSHTELPISVGFGIRTPEQAAAIARVADAAVVGTAIIDEVAASLGPAGEAGPDTVARVLAIVRNLAQGVRGARNGGST